MKDTRDEYQQLAKHYGAMYDEELLQLAADFDNLTDIAQEVLRSEVLHRNLSMPQHAADATDLPDAGEGEIPVTAEMDLTADGNVLIGRFNSSEAASIAYWALEMADIPSKVVTPASGLASTPRLQIAPEDIERAKAVLAQPISDEVMDQYESAKSSGDFQSPDCPVCGTPDPLLESADPVNEWFCESCGHQWKEAANPAL